jgi:outer membrane protein TolC
LGTRPISLHLFFIYVACLLCVFNIYGQDCTLAGFLNKGVSNSPLLKDLSNQILTNQYDSLIARATYLPQVNFNGSLMYAPVINGWGYSEVITNGQNLIGTLNASQKIFNRKTREADFEKYALESGNIVNNRKISLGELKKAITSQYLAACVALEDRKFQQELLQNLENESRVLKAWTDQGIYHHTDYLVFQLAIISMQRNIRDLDLQYRKEFWNLDLICGIEDTTSCDLQLPFVEDTATATIEKSLFFRQFQIDSLLIRNEQLLIDRRYKPSIGWFADGGIVNNEPRYIYQNMGVSIGLSMTLPVFDGNQRKINYSRIHVREETRKNYLENFKLRYQFKLKQLYAELEQIRISMKENEKQIALIKELVAADKILLNSGSLPITDYILAIRSLVEAMHDALLYQIKTRYILNEINFSKQ